VIRLSDFPNTDDAARCVRLCAAIAQVQAELLRLSPDGDALDNATCALTEHADEMATVLRVALWRDVDAKREAA